MSGIIFLCNSYMFTSAFNTTHIRYISVLLSSNITSFIISMIYVGINPHLYIVDVDFGPG